MSTKAERGTSPWWLDRLGKKLDERAKTMRKFDDYYSGIQGRRILTTSYRQLFEEVLGAYAENFCLPTGSPVLTDAGFVPIDLIRPGQGVLTHDGLVKPVQRVMERSVDEDIVALHTFGSPVARMTANHPVLASRGADLLPINGKYRSEEHFQAYGLAPRKAYRMDSAVPTWIDAGELAVGDVIWCARPGPGTTTADEALLALVGWYLAEGSVSDTGRLAFSLHAEELDYQDEIEGLLRAVFGVRHVSRVPTSPNAIQVVTYSKDLCAEFVRLGGRGAAGKRLAPELMAAENVAPLLRAAFRGDGTRGRIQIAYTTISLAWATQVQRLLMREGIPVGWQTAPAREGHREGYKLAISGAAAQRLAEVVGWSIEAGTYQKAPTAAIVEDMAGYAIKAVDRQPYVGSVWDLTVADSHSFVLPGQVAVHNCGIVVDAVAQRLQVQGFRFPPSDGWGHRTARDPGPADGDAWRIWQDNQLDAESAIAHTESLVKAVSYVLVSPFRSEFIGDRSPRITVEDALEAIVEYRSGSNERIVGMKRWWDDEEASYLATLYYPNRIEKWRADGRHTQDSMAMRLATGEGANWRAREVRGEVWPLPNPLGEVPLLELRNRPRLGHRVESEIAQIMPIQDAINTLAFNELVASDAAAFPQKWATGVEIPVDPKTNKPPADWNPDINRILSTLVPDAKFGTFAAADLNQWGAAIDRRVKRIASITATPYHFFLDHGGQPPSGESLRSAETGLVRKAQSKHLHLGEAWEEAIRLAFAVLEDPRALILDSEVNWVNPETLTEAEHVDALVKLSSIDVPREQLWEDAGYSPTQIARFGEAQERPGEAGIAPQPDAPAAAAVDFSVVGAWLLEALSQIADGIRPTVTVAPAQTTIAPGAVQVRVEPPATLRPTRSRIERDAKGRPSAIVQE